MDRFSYLDIVVIAVVGLLVVFLVLMSWQLIRQLVIVGSKFAKMNKKTDVLVQAKQDSSAIDEEDETKMVAVLMALILANEDQQDKSYQITKIERIR